nr:MAG TPA: Nuclease [Caudoviricetes sp.]
MAKEKNFENKIKNELHRRDAWRVKFFANAYTPSGIPDILSCLKGHFLGIEVKSGSSYGLTELQKYNLKCIRKAGGIGICVYPSGWEQFLQLLDDIQAGRAININDDNYIMK